MSGGRDTLRGMFIGREREIERLNELLDAAGSGHGGLRVL
jgi:hypothetical protein